MTVCCYFITTSITSKKATTSTVNMLPQIVLFALAAHSQNHQTGWSSTRIPGNYLCDAQVLLLIFEI